ncbi:hypothetical protein [Parabacteroides chongii]|uniref:hypothetical protein n=1 Tax=Parabacteroides chongii TaxID=2685834 RepID=UPI00240D8F6B|nr:hypothetical protein [Parabacteroides chongii]WFE85047.1 hypothetical protein P3L47_00095 [Parabacteroides chongii]
MEWFGNVGTTSSERVAVFGNKLEYFLFAISNNLPILVDELKKASAQYKAFKAAVAAGNNDVAKVAPVWKQLISSVFSWQTALVVAITLLSVYGKDVIEWTKSLFGADTAQKEVE